MVFSEKKQRQCKYYKESLHWNFDINFVVHCILHCFYLWIQVISFLEKSTGKNEEMDNEYNEKDISPVDAFWALMSKKQAPKTGKRI